MPLTVDSHCHVSPIWYEPVETLLYQMDTNGVHGAVLIQMQGQTDNTYQQACVRRYPGRFASVVLVDPDQPDAPHELRRLADEGASGVRLRAAARSPGTDPLAIWRTAAELGLAVSCPITPADLVPFTQLLEALPRLTVVLEHLGGSSRADSDLSGREATFALARFPNVSIKVPGLGELAVRANPAWASFPFERPIPDALRQAYAAFGPERTMWGSDFPPVAAREGYANALQLCRAEFADEPDEARRSIFGEVAARVFPIR
jgi:L-fuconolactonase